MAPGALEGWGLVDEGCELEGVGGFLLPLEPDRPLPLEPGRVLPSAVGRLLLVVVGRLLLPSWDAAPLRGAVVTVGFWSGEAPLDFRLRAPSRHSPPAGSLLPVGSSGGARPTRLVRGTVTWTSMWMFLGRGRCPVPEGVHHGLVDPTRELKVPRSPSRGTPSGSNRPGEAELLEGAKGAVSSLTPSRPPPKPPVTSSPPVPSLRLLVRPPLMTRPPVPPRVSLRLPSSVPLLLSWFVLAGVSSSGACMGP